VVLRTEELVSQVVNIPMAKMEMIAPSRIQARVTILQLLSVILIAPSLWCSRLTRFTSARVLDFRIM
jgi:hypothetical protein